MADTTTTLTTSSAINLPDPPRLFGDWAFDGPSISQWFKDLIAAFRQQSSTIDGLAGTPGGDISVGDLPDPASTSLARAQQTANEAFINAAAAAVAAAAAAVLARSVVVFSGQVTISGVSTSGAATFA